MLHIYCLYHTSPNPENKHSYSFSGFRPSLLATTTTFQLQKRVFMLIFGVPTSHIPPNPENEHVLGWDLSLGATAPQPHSLAAANTPTPKPMFLGVGTFLWPPLPPFNPENEQQGLVFRVGTFLWPPPPPRPEN